MYIYIYCIWSPHPPEPTLSIDHGKHSPARIPGPLHWVTCTWRCLRLLMALGRSPSVTSKTTSKSSKKKVGKQF